MFVLGPN